MWWRESLWGMLTRCMVPLLAIFLPVFAGVAERPDVWGKPPEASDDRFTNPEKPLYAGPHGWWNTGEVRAQGASGVAFQFHGSFTTNNGLFIAVKDLQTLTMDFGAEGRPAAGDYKIGAKGDATARTVRFSFSEMGGSRIREWTSGADAGVLTVKLDHGFTVFTCRDVTLKATTEGSGGKEAQLTLGFEGALSPE
jgi:hypothetical protein